MKLLKGFFFLFTLCLAGNIHSALSGEVENGLTYTIVQENTDATTIQLNVNTGFSSENEIQQGLSQLLAFALIQETELLSRGEIQSLLHECRQDISPWAHIQVGPDMTTFTFRVPRDKEQYLKKMLNFVKQVSQHPTLSGNALELAREDLLEMLLSQTPNDVRDQILAFMQLLFSFTQNQMIEFFHAHYCPHLMKLMLTGPLDESEVEETILDIFGPLIRRTAPQNTVKQSIKPMGKTVVIDGKITMNDPSWAQTRWWGTLVAIFCGVIAAGCFFAGSFFPPLIALGFLPLGGAVYFYADPYLKDPVVIEEKRHEDLQKGFRYSYLKKRAGRTLTPFERRSLFIQENSIAADPYPEEFHRFAIADLADIYRINDKIFVPMLHPAEQDSLAEIKQAFILQRNDIKKAKKALNEELNKYLSTHQSLRDQKLDLARQNYESHPAVILMRQITEEWADVITELWKDFESRLISEEVLEEYIDEANKTYETLLSDPELLAGVQDAKEALDYQQQMILKDYEEAVQLVKMTINYDQRAAVIDAGKWALYTHYNIELINYVYKIPGDDPSFPDFLDLR